MATNGSHLFRRKCIAVILALLLMQGALLLCIRPSALFHTQFSSFQLNPRFDSNSPSLEKNTKPPSTNEPPPSKDLNSLFTKLNSSTESSSVPTSVSSMSETTSSNRLTTHVNPLSTEQPSSTSLESDPTTEKPPSNTTYTLRPPNVASYSTWEKGTFCDKYIGNTLNKSLHVCAARNNESSVTCEGSTVSSNMARCTARYLAVEPRKFQSVVRDCDACMIDHSGSFHLIKSNFSSCPEPTLKDLESHSERNDPLYRSMIDITSNPAVSSETCTQWINKTAFFFPSQRYHIYFRFYSYYNLYKTLLDKAAVPGDYIVVRMSEATGYKFENFERLLFPELKTLSEFPDGRVCFREVVFSPWTYAAVMFRCKMESQTKYKCLQCEGKGKLGTSLMTFRTRALQACSLKDQTPEERKSRERKSIVFVKRKPYHRWKGDRAENFQRVLTNQDDVVKNLKSHFQDTEVHDVFMEDLDLCQQMTLVHESDIYIGVHGAGLVHLWWLHDDASALELAPSSFSQNPSFKTLAKLTGRRYHFHGISGTQYQVKADIPKMMDMVKDIISGKR